MGLGIDFNTGNIFLTLGSTAVSASGYWNDTTAKWNDTTVTWNQV